MNEDPYGHAATQQAVEVACALQGDRCARCDGPLGDDVHVIRDAEGLISEVTCDNCHGPLSHR